MKCPSGCACGRHKGRTCETGCTCTRHTPGKPYTGKSYFDKHRDVRKARGKASDQRCVECGEQAKHWATVHGTDGTDPAEHYLAMCISCHHAYDKSHERAGFHGRKHTEATKKKISEAGRGKSWLHTASPEKRAEFGRRISESKIGKPSPNKGKKLSKPAWNKGVPLSKERSDGLKAYNEAHRAPTPCEICGLVCVSPRGLAIHTAKRHGK